MKNFLTVFFSLLLFPISLITGCGNQIEKVPPLPGTLPNILTAPEKVDTDVYFDATVSMKGFTTLAAGNVYIALDISPSGYNPSACKPYDKEKAYDLYSKIINAGKEGTDLIFIETISIIEDIETLCEAAKDNCELPIFASMTFTGKQNTWFGYPLDNWISRSNDLPIDAVGMNCSLTPTEMYPLAGKLVKGSNKPVFVKPNRGQPEKEDNKSVYKLSADQFAEDMLKFRDLGIHIMGGCCGTDHECISKMKILLNQN